MFNRLIKIMNSLKKPALAAGISGLSSVMACVYGPDPIYEECDAGARDCLENYVMMCDYSNHGDIIWYSSLCTKGCSNGQCIDNQYATDIVTDCKPGETRCVNQHVEICVDQIWFKDPYDREKCSE